MTLPIPLSRGETIRVRAFDSAVRVDGCGEPSELLSGESASYVVVVIDEGLSTEVRRWERVPALPGSA